MAADAQIPTGRLLERDAELEVIDRALGRARDDLGALVMVDAPAGGGKTALLETARAGAADTDLLTLSARGAELEHAFAFGVVRQLFDPVLRDPAIETEELFTGAARQAAALLGFEEGDDTPAPSQDPFATRHAIYWLTANLAAQRPLALFVDDAHWADVASLGALAHLALRLEGLPVALVVTSRSEESLPELDAIRGQADDDGTRIRLSPLGEEAAAAVVRSFVPSADDARCRACFRATGGNPFLLQELARAVQAGEADGDLADQSPESVTREVGARLRRLPDPAGDLARAAAVLGEDVPLREAAELAGVELDDAAEAADTLVSAGVLRSAEPLEFMHPLVLAGVYAGLGPAARSKEHARAAHQLADEGASPERVAAQLLRAQPAGDEWACDQLVSAAQLASARGAAGEAAAYLQRALLEPPPRERRGEILLALGTAGATAPDPEAAIGHLREALAADIDDEQRFEATMLVAGLLGHAYRLAEAADVIESQLDELANRPELQATAEAALTNVTRVDPVARPRAADTIARLRSRVEAGDERDPAVLGTIATEMVMAGEPAREVAQVAEQAIVGFEGAGTAASAWSGFNAIRSLVIAERYDLALRTLDRALEMSRERGSVMEFGGCYAFRCELHLRTGDLASAEVDARTLMEVATAARWTGGRGFAVAWLGEVLVERGELREAEELLEGDDATGTEVLARGYSAAEVMIARARLRRAQRRTQDAIEDLREAGRWSTAIGNINPAAVPWRSHLAHALVDAGHTHEASRLAHEELALARAFGTPRALAMSMRAVARAHGGEQERRMLRNAIDIVDNSAAQLERARVHAALGEAISRAGRPGAARESLRVAVDLAHRCGARVLEDETLELLRATGARPRRLLTTGADALTPSERRITELAASGQQNREIAQSLFVSTNTVEFHLRNAYRKLGISSRAGLKGALGLADEEAEENPA